MKFYKLDPDKVFPGSVLTPPPKPRQWNVPYPAQDLLEFQQERWKQSPAETFDRWARLNAKLDYHNGEWWIFDDELEDWAKLPRWASDEVLFEAGIGHRIRSEQILNDFGKPTGNWRRIPDEEREYVKALFRRRNDEAHQMGRLPEGASQPKPKQDTQTEFDL